MRKPDGPVVHVVERNSVCLSSCQGISCWMPFSIIFHHISNFYPATAVCLRFWFTRVDFGLILLASDGMCAQSSVSPCELWPFKNGHLRHDLIVKTCTSVSATMLLHIASVEARSRWSSIEVRCAPSSSAALEIALLGRHCVCVHTFFLSFHACLVPVVAILLLCLHLSSELPVAIVVAVCRGLVGSAVPWFGFRFARSGLRSVPRGHVVVWRAHSLTVARVGCSRSMIELTVVQTISSRNCFAICWCLLDCCSERQRDAIFPSFSAISGVAPDSCFTIWVSAIVVASFSSFANWYLSRMRVRRLDTPSLANLSGDGSLLASSVI